VITDILSLFWGFYFYSSKSYIIAKF